MTHGYINGLPRLLAAQEEADLDRAHEELRGFRLDLNRAIAAVSSNLNLNPLINATDASVYLARLRVQAAEGVIHNLTSYYDRIRAHYAALEPPVNVLDNESQSSDEFPIKENDPWFGNGTQRPVDTTIIGLAAHGVNEGNATVSTDPSPPYCSLPGSPVLEPVGVPPETPPRARTPILPGGWVESQDHHDGLTPTRARGAINSPQGHHQAAGTQSPQANVTTTPHPVFQPGPRRPFGPPQATASQPVAQQANVTTTPHPVFQPGPRWPFGPQQATASQPVAQQAPGTPSNRSQQAGATVGRPVSGNPPATPSNRSQKVSATLERPVSGNPPATPSTPSRRANVTVGQSRLSNPPATPSNPSQQGATSQTTPATPSNPSQQGAASQTTPSTPTSPSTTRFYNSDRRFLTPAFPRQRHYAVTRGRRTGVYSSWNEAQIYVDGLDRAVYQQFPSYNAALVTYLRLRSLGRVEVVRGPGDTNEEFGDPNIAEDL